MITVEDNKKIQWNIHCFRRDWKENDKCERKTYQKALNVSQTSEKKNKKWQLCILHQQTKCNFNTYVQITFYMLFTK